VIRKLHVLADVTRNRQLAAMLASFVAVNHWPAFRRANVAAISAAAFCTFR
jgi:hypothetical protein